MAQEETYIAIVSERLSKPGDTRYVIIDKQTQQEVDTCNGRGYKSPQSAHKSFAFKQRQRQRGGQQGYGRSSYAVRGNAQAQAKTFPISGGGSQAATIDPQTGVTKVNTWSGYAPRRAPGVRKSPASPKPALRPAEPTLQFSASPRQTSSPVGLVSPFVQEEMASAGQSSQQAFKKQPVTATVDNGGSAGQRLTENQQPVPLASRFSPRQWTCQEDTPRPPEFFGSNK